MTMLDLSESGELIISIDLDHRADLRVAQGGGSRDETTTWLLDTLAYLKIAATWALPNPASCELTHRLAESGEGHEIAVLGEERWVGPRAGRKLLSRELSRRVDRISTAIRIQFAAGVNDVPGVK